LKLASHGNLLGAADRCTVYCHVMEKSISTVDSCAKKLLARE